MVRSKAVRLMALLVLTVPAVSLAQGKSGGKGKSESKAQAATVVFHNPHGPAMREYFRANKIVAKPLPPGIEKNVARGKPLPPGIAKRPMPSRLVSQLPVVSGVSYLLVGNNAVAMRQGKVVDVMFNVF